MKRGLRIILLFLVAFEPTYFAGQRWTNTKRRNRGGEREREKKKKGRKEVSREIFKHKNDKYKLTGRYKEKYERRNRKICWILERKWLE